MRSFKTKRGRNPINLPGILSFFLPSILAFFLLSLLAKTTLAQDWVVTGTQVVENDTIVLNGNLIVESGGDLTLRSVTLTMNNSYNGQYGIRVKSGGLIAIESASVITAASNSARFSFAVEAGADLMMKDSKLSRCGWGPDSEDLWDNATNLSGKRGLVVDTGNAVIRGNTLSNNHVGIILTGHGITADNNNIHSNKVHGIYIRGGTKCQITNNTIQHSSISSPFRIVEGEDNTIKGNTITLSEIHRGVVETMWSHKNTFESNTIFGFGVGFSIMHVSNNNLVKNNNISTDEAGIAVWGWNNRLEGNTISDSSERPQTGIYLVYAYNSEIIDNNITGDTGEGIWLRHSSNNTIVNNRISASTSVELVRKNGLLLMNNCKRNVIFGNSISGFPRGICLFYSSDENTITGNEVSNISLQTAIMDDSSGNTIFNNNFLNMGRAPYDNGQNQWDYDGQGNYWSEYRGSDANGDGIGDAPYPIAPEGNDNGPFMTPIDLTTLPVPEAEPANPPNPGELFEKTITGEEVIENQTIMLGDLGAADGGSLTLRNVTLITGGSNRSSDLFVAPGGSLYIYNCQIRHLEYSYGFQIATPEGSTFVMKDSILQGCGQEWPYGGLQIRTDNAIIENNEISDTTISFFNTASGRVVNNTISRSFWTIYVEESDNITITNNILSKSIDGVIHSWGGVGHTIRNNTIKDFWGDGILRYRSPGSTAIGNQISGGKADISAISLGGPNATIKNNIISNCLIGIRTNEDSNTVVGNKISNCSVGLDIGWNNSHIERNTISNCSVGIYLGSGHTFLGNVISGCETGLRLTMGSLQNVIYRNDFINNTLQAEDPGQNRWDYNGQGNYWSDYTGDDAYGDGIGDTPYYIGPNGVDYYPLMAPFQLSRPSMPWILLLLLDE